MSNFLTKEELAALHLASCGEDVKVSPLAVLREPERLHIGSHVRIDDFATISGDVTLGNYIHIATGAGLYGGDAGIAAEDFANISARCSIYAVSDDFTGGGMTSPVVPDKYKPTIIEKAVHIGRHAILGCNSVVLPGVDIAEGTAAGALTLCNKSTEKWTMYAGIPARKIGARSQKPLELEQLMMRDMAGVVDRTRGGGRLSAVWRRADRIRETYPSLRFGTRTSCAMCKAAV